MTTDDRRFRLRCLVIGVAAFAVTSCTRHYPPAPVVSGGGAASRPYATARFTGKRPDSITVAPGETLYAVSRRYDVPVRSLIEANNLAPPFHLVVGRRLILPQVRQYTVAPGDTLYSISRRFGVDTSTLAKTNELAPPYPIHVGQALALPAPVQVATAAPPPPPPPPSRRAAPVIYATPPAPPRREASRAESARSEPAAAPRETAPTPPAPASPQPPPRPEAPARLAVHEPASAAAKPSEPQAPEPQAPEAESPKAVAAAPAPPPAAAAPEALPSPAHTALGFQWPVRGSILVAYGPGAGGTQNDGINIAAARGTPVVAANAGIVRYSGNELRGFGNLILIQHKDGWMTAYAHCETLLVKRQEHVARGQIIARVGATGTVSEPQLHFEIRHRTQPVDPVSYLPPISTASAQ